MSCPFCERLGIRVNNHWKLIEDAYPVSKGHHLLVPFEHTPTMRDLSSEQWASLSDAIELSLIVLTNTEDMLDFNFGLNNGNNAGQTIDHVHFHFIPRECGDVENPRGGIRGVIPWKKEY